MQTSKRIELNVVTRITVVKKGDQIPIEVEGGWVRSKAASSGYLAETRRGNIVFIPAKTIPGTSGRR